jgi:tripartite-type tricarboxylate transporter receptor subunit TctC
MHSVQSWLKPISGAVVSLLVALLAHHAIAQTEAAKFPNKPMRIVIPFGPGGGNDIVARLLAVKLGESLGQPVVVDNKPGGQGAIAAEFVMKSAPDGHVVLMGPSGVMTANPAIHTKLPYSTMRDFMAVTMIGSFPLILVVNASMPVKSVQELIEYAKTRPDKMNYGSTTALFQLTSELFNQKVGTKFQHIPYKSSGDFVNAILSGEITMAFADPPPASGHIKAGKLRALGVTAAQRLPAFPDVPTMAEAGVADMVIPVWMGMFLPIGAPAPIALKLRDEIVRVLAAADVRERFAGLGVDPSGMTGEEFGRIVAADIARWAAVVKSAGLKAD